MTERIQNLGKKTPTRTPKHAKMGLWEGPGGIFSSSRFSTALRVAFGHVFGGFWGALETILASLGTKNMIRNRHQFEAFVEHAFV